MIDSDLCRAARGLLDWSQQQLAEAAQVGLSTVKRFEANHGMPVKNNLAAIRHALEQGGVGFISEEEGGPGVLKQLLRFRAYIRGEGLHFEIEYADLMLEELDNVFSLSFRINETALAKLAGRPIVDEADAKAAVRKKQASLIATIKRKLGRPIFDP